MSTPRFIADTHMGHRNIWKFRPVFESTLHNDLYFQYVLAEICTKRDSMFFLGDILFDEKYLPFIKELPGTKILVLGNHCTEYISTKKLCDAFDEVHSMIRYKEFWLTHAPIHPDELREKKNIHGHVHTESINDFNYLNVSVDSSFMNFLPKTLLEVRQAFATVNTEQKIYAGVDNENALNVIESNPISKNAYYRSLAESRKITV
ncbi:Phosphoesterase [Yersinia phage fHe-Yen9-04]|nr:phosphoesterase [Yersinia phage fHe-Yen9-04]SOK58536.1 Phosphoesterase [Yersinia phage fHe-Yen9-04]VUE36305.1 Phosphoesterase [Yersinia phage fHe-Yen9-04]